MWLGGGNSRAPPPLYETLSVLYMHSLGSGSLHACECGSAYDTVRAVQYTACGPRLADTRADYSNRYTCGPRSWVRRFGRNVSAVSTVTPSANLYTKHWQRATHKPTNRCTCAHGVHVHSRVLISTHIFVVTSRC